MKQNVPTFLFSDPRHPGVNVKLFVSDEAKSKVS